MTGRGRPALPRIPNSIADAWSLTGGLCGWPELAEACGVSEDTCRKWGQEDSGRDLPLRCAEIGDDLLEHLEPPQPRINEIAWTKRRGGRDQDPLAHLEDIAHAFRQACRLIEGCPEHMWNFIALSRALTDIRKLGLELDEHMQNRHDIEWQELRAKLRATVERAQELREHEPPKLRAVTAKTA